MLASILITSLADAPVCNSISVPIEVSTAVLEDMPPCAMEPVAPLISKFLLVEKEPVEVFILALVEVISYNVPCQLALAKLLSD